MGEVAMKPQHSLNSFAKELRNNSTDAERLPWRYLRNGQLEGIKFRRQQPIETYIIDFVAFDKRIVIELDGGQHAENTEYGEHRDACLRRNGFIVLRFWNNDVFENIVGVLEVIRLRCLEIASPTPQPPPARGGGASKNRMKL
jgi:very-short-patch-repair endonuclease